jgi:hypothetical protein
MCEDLRKWASDSIPLQNHFQFYFKTTFHSTSKPLSIPLQNYLPFHFKTTFHSTSKPHSIPLKSNLPFHFKTTLSPQNPKVWHIYGGSKKYLHIYNKETGM